MQHNPNENHLHLNNALGLYIVGSRSCEVLALGVNILRFEKAESPRSFVIIVRKNYLGSFRKLRAPISSTRYQDPVAKRVPKHGTLTILSHHEKTNI